jgi:hypothetical protein
MTCEAIMAKRRVSLTAILLALTTVLAGCGGRSPAAPSAGLSGDSTPGQTATQIRGIVSDSVFLPVANARIEILDGPDTGKTTTTDASGAFSLTAVADDMTRLRARKEGYGEGITMRALHPDAPPGWVWIALATVTPPARIAGRYTVTLVADSACTNIPTALRTRTYDATIAENSDPRQPAGTSFSATINGVPIVPGRGAFAVGVAGDVIAFLLGDHGPYFAEQVSSDRYIAFEGRAVLNWTSAASHSTSFQGWATYGDTARLSSPAASEVCASTNHQLIVTKQ